MSLPLSVACRASEWDRWENSSWASREILKAAASRSAECPMTSLEENSAMPGSCRWNGSKLTRFIFSIFQQRTWMRQTDEESCIHLRNNSDKKLLLLDVVLLTNGFSFLESTLRSKLILRWSYVSESRCLFYLYLFIQYLAMIDRVGRRPRLSYDN